MSEDFLVSAKVDGGAMFSADGKLTGFDPFVLRGEIVDGALVLVSSLRLENGLK